MSLINDIRQDLDGSALRLISEYRDRLFAEAVRMSCDVPSAEDLVSRTFDKAIRNLDSYTKDENLFGWMKTIMVNLRRDDLRHPVARNTTPVDPSVLAECSAEDWRTDEEILKRSDSQALREALGRLDPEFKKTMVLHYLAEMPVKQIAVVLNVPVGTVLWRMNIARKILARDLADKLGKKPVAVLLAVLLGIGSLFGAWKAAEAIWPEAFSALEAETVSSFDVPQADEDLMRGATETQTGEEVESYLTKEGAKERETMNMKTIKSSVAAVAAAVSLNVFAGSEYRFAEYIERDSSSTINTGVKITANTTKVEFGVQDSLGETGSQDKKLMGDSSEKFGFATYKSQWRILSRSYVSGGPAKDTQRIDVSVTGDSSATSWQIVRADGETAELAGKGFSDAGNVIYVFGLGGTVSAPKGFRLFYLKHYEMIEGVETLSNFVVPAERLRDHAVGLYDVITDNFFSPSSGTAVVAEAGNTMLSDVLEVVGTPSKRGAVTPAYGMHLGYPAGTPVTVTAPASWTSDDGKIRSVCVGYRVYTNDVEWMSGEFSGEEEARMVDFTRPECAEGVRIEWLWNELVRVTVSTPEVGGGIKGETDFWATVGEEVSIEAEPADGYSFLRFTGDVTPEKEYDNPLTFTATEPVALTAQFAQGAATPVVVRSKSVFWLDASDVSTLQCDENNLVTTWTSRTPDDTKCATVPSGCLAPTNDTTTFGIATVDFGKASSNIDMTFPRITDVRTIFFVVKIENTKSAFLIGDSSSYQFHRGDLGQYGDGKNSRYSKVWDLGREIAAPATTVIPDDSFRVIAIRTSTDCSVSSLTRDRNGINDRSGGKQLSELIVFNEVLDDAQVATVNAYLMRKWGFATEKLAVVGSPDEYAGYPTPDYGNHTEFKTGDTVTFKMSGSVFTNDSQTFSTELTGWMFLDSDGNQTVGTGTEKTMTYGEALMYSSFTWNWSGEWTRVHVKQPLEPRLPRTYREVEYLETGADGSIATGVGLTTNTSEVAFRFGVSDDFVYPSSTSDDSKWFGSTEGGKTMFALGHYCGKWRITAHASVWKEVSYHSASRGPIDVVIRGKTWAFIDSTDDTHSLETANDPLVRDANSTSTIGIFGSSGLRAPAGVRFYGMRIWEKGVLVHHLVPCYRRAHKNKATEQVLEPSVPGVYDRVTGSFAAGSGTIACGPEIPYNSGLMIYIW